MTNMADFMREIDLEEGNEREFMKTLSPDEIEDYERYLFDSFIESQND